MGFLGGRWMLSRVRWAWCCMAWHGVWEDDTPHA